MRAAIQKFLPAAAILAAYVWASITILGGRKSDQPADARILRIGHWQLESGVREGLDQLGKKFAALPEIRQKYGDVVVVQDAIPESTYGQWVSCQMMGGTAPDLIEWGLGLPPNIWLAYANRYCVPLTDIANRPNPFNRGTMLEGVPLRNTFSDDMRSGYQEELQQFMRVNLSRFSTRVFYNKSLLKKLTGLDEPPKDFRGFSATCRAIAAVRDPATNKNYTPIASSAYHTQMWNAAVADPMTFSAIQQADFNRDGTVGSDETYVAFKTGRLSFDTPAMRAKLKMAHDLQQFYQTGFTGLSRDEGVFLFAQERAVFISSGTWDVGSLIAIARGKFDVGIMNFPRPDASDPEYGSLAQGPVYDPAAQGFAFAVTHFRPENTELAEAFLLYLSSMQGNSELNQFIGWIPSVKTAKLPHVLADFAPKNQGMFATTAIDGLGGKTYVKWAQSLSLFQTDPSYTLDKFTREFTPYYKEQGLIDWQEQQRDWRRAILNNDQFLAGLRGQLLLTQVPTDDSRWITYRSYVASRQVFSEVWHKQQEAMVINGPERPVGPYEFLPSAVQSLQNRFAARNLQTQPAKGN